MKKEPKKTPGENVWVATMELRWKAIDESTEDYFYNNELQQLFKCISGPKAGEYEYRKVPFVY